MFTLRMSLPSDPDAPEFVPSKTFLPDVSWMGSTVVAVVRTCGMAGVKVKDLPSLFKAQTGNDFDLTNTGFTDLSSYLRSLRDVAVTTQQNVPSSSNARMTLAASVIKGRMVSHHTAISAAATTVGHFGDSKKVDMLSLGDAAEAVVVALESSKFKQDLSIFQAFVYQVVYQFGVSQRGTQKWYMTASGEVAPISNSGGIALSLFAMEWNRFCGLLGIAVDLKELREMFGVSNLQPFLESIPGLEIFGINHAKRVRVRQMPGVPTSPFNYCGSEAIHDYPQGCYGLNVTKTSNLKKTKSVLPISLSDILLLPGSSRSKAISEESTSPREVEVHREPPHITISVM